MESQKKQKQTDETEIKYDVLSISKEAAAENNLKALALKEKKTKRNRNYRLAPYKRSTIAFLVREDLEDPTELQRRVFESIGNYHPKKPNVKQRTPNVAIDNFVLFYEPKKKEFHCVLGFCNKEINGKKVQGWCTSGGHVEYEEDLTLQEASLRELREEFGIKKEDIISSIPLALVDDFVRDFRNKYLTQVFGYFVNAKPKATEEHETLVWFPLKQLEGILTESGKLLHPKLNKEFGFVHGHDSILAALLKTPQYCAWLEEISLLSGGGS